jgi:hypothetical protein
VAVSLALCTEMTSIALVSEPILHEENQREEIHFDFLESKMILEIEILRGEQDSRFVDGEPHGFFLVEIVARIDWALLLVGSLVIQIPRQCRRPELIHGDIPTRRAPGKSR